jgi:uncharacterized protein YjiS (DUF1127 family)
MINQDVPFLAHRTFNYGETVMAFIERKARRTTFVPGPFDLIKMARKSMKRRNKRKEFAVLLNQEDWVLKDMGVTRQDVREALATKGDPALNLRALIARRRFWSRKRDTI